MRMSASSSGTSRSSSEPRFSTSGSAQPAARGAEVITLNPAGSAALQPGSAAWAAAQLQAESPVEELRDAKRSLDEAERVAIVWSEDDPTGGAHALALAESLGDKASVYLIPRTPNGRGVAAAWGDPGTVPEGEIGALIVSGDEAAGNPDVRDLAERARFVITTAMFESEGTLWSHLVLPGTSYLERDGTTVNLEGRPQRQRRAVAPPPRTSSPSSPGSPAASASRSTPGPRCCPTTTPHCRRPEERGRSRGGAQSGRPETWAGPRARALPVPLQRAGGRARRSSSSSSARPDEVELSYEDASARGIAAGSTVTVSSNGTSRSLRARVNRRLRKGVVRIPSEHAEGLHDRVEVKAG